MHWFTRAAIWNRWLTLLVVFLIMGISVISLFQLKTELIPDIELPYIAVVGISQGNSPEEIIENISIPAEGEISKVGGLKHIESYSSEGSCFIFATFDYGTDMEEAEEDILERLRLHPTLGNLVQSEESFQQLQVARISFDMMPLVWITLSADDDLTPTELRSLAQDLVNDTDVEGLLEDETPFTKRVEISGGQEDLLVIPNVEALNENGLPVAVLVEALKSKPEYASPEDIRNLQVSQDSGITVGDVAVVMDETIPNSRTDGSDSISIIWRKDPDANTVDVANAIMERVEEFEETHAEENVHVSVIMDQSEEIEKSIADLTRDALIGIVLAALIILLFLWTFRASLIIIISIPVSILAGFLLMYAMDITINILTLGGIAIAVGRIVDNSIVSLENIYRHLQRGEGFRKACIDGVKEIAMPITSATIATVAIFIPLVLVGGMVGELFRPFALVVTFALVASLIVALMLIPPLSSFLGTKKASFEGSDNWYTRLYTRSLRWALGHRALTVGATLTLFVASLLILPMLGTSFLSGGSDNTMTVEIRMTCGNNSDLAEKMAGVEARIRELDNEEGMIEGYNSYIGDPMGGTGSDHGLATIVVDLSDSADVDQQARALSDKCAPLRDEAVTSIEVSAGSMGSDTLASDRLEIKVIGEEGIDETRRQQVTDATEALYDKIRQLEIEGEIENLESELVQDLTSLTAEGLPGSLVPQWDWMRVGWPEYNNNGQLLYIVPGGDDIEVNGMGFDLVPAPVVTLYDISTADVSVGSIVREVRNVDPIESIETIRGLWIEVPGEGPIRLGEVATVNWAPKELRRAEGGYAGTVLAKITADDVGAVNREVEDLIDEMRLENGEFPEGIDDIKTGGVAEQMEEGFQDMGIAVILAILIVFVVLAISFRSWLTPLLIMFTMPMASIGAVLALLVAGCPIGMSAMMGILMLVGIVLTNAIVLLTFVEDRRKEGTSTYDALMDAGRIRLRPILMTALTTIFALVPLALGLSEGALIAAELGVVVIGGLVSSTVLTLIVVPVLYSLTDRVRRNPYSKVKSAPAEPRD